MSICPVCMKRPCACKIKPPAKFLRAMEASAEKHAKNKRNGDTSATPMDDFTNDMGEPFYPVEKIEIFVSGKSFSAKTFDEAADIVSKEKGEAVIDILWKNDMSFKFYIFLDGDRNRIEPSLIRHLEENAGLRTPEGMEVQEYERRLKGYSSAVMAIAIGILGTCDTGLKSGRCLQDPAFAIDLDTNGVVLSGERGIVNIKAMHLISESKTDMVRELLKDHGLPIPDIKIGILYGPFTPIEICKIHEMSGFASTLYKERYQSLPEMK